MRIDRRDFTLMSGAAVVAAVVPGCATLSGSSKMYGLIGKMTAKPGQRRAVVQRLLESGRVFDDNAACLLYLVTEPVDSPDDIWVIDLWTTQEEHTKALEAPEMQPYIAATMPLLEGTPHQIEVVALGGKGLPES